jgi:hypothetical protein
MAKGKLPAEWEAMSHSARVRKAVEVGKKSRTDAKAERLLRDWRTGGFTQRLLATFACHGSRDSAALVVMTADPSRMIARIALSVLCDVGDDNSLLAALRAIAPKQAAKALFWLGRRRLRVVDHFVTERAEANDASAWPLVPLASPAVLDRFFADAAELGGEIFWRRLAVMHPARAATEIIARLNAATSPDGLLFWYARIVLAILSNSQPDTALTVVNALRRHMPLASIALHTLVGRRPIAIADLILSSTEAASVSFERVAHRLATARIIALFRRAAYYLGNPDRWLARLPAADREAIYRELAPVWTAVDGVVPVFILRRLPSALRAGEARRVLALPDLATRPLQQLPYAALLPWAEAREQVKLWLGHPEAENRAASLVALCEATRFQRTRLADLLELLTARKHEQDPVRLAFLGTLAVLPPGRWRAEHLPALAQVIRDALDAADLSSGSTVALGRLIFSLLPFHPEWTVKQLAELTRERGFPAWTGRLLTPEEVRRIAPPLTPIIRAWVGSKREYNIIALATNVDRRLPHWPELIEVLERLIRKATHSSTSAGAMALIAEHHRAVRERVIVAALKRDESWVLQPAVMNFLHSRRQDLLTPFLGQRSYSGLFKTGSARYVLPFAAGFYRWTDSQQEKFSKSLAALAKKQSHTKNVQVTWEVLGAIRRLALKQARFMRASP